MTPITIKTCVNGRKQGSGAALTILLSANKAQLPIPFCGLRD